MHTLSRTKSFQEMLFALSESDYRPSLYTVRLRSRRFCLAGALPETPRSNDFTELGFFEILARSTKCPTGRATIANLPNVRFAPTAIVATHDLRQLEMSPGEGQLNRPFLRWGLNSFASRGRRVKPPHCVTRRPGVDLSGLEHMVLLATSARRLGRTGHVELLLLLGNVGQDRTQALVLDDRGLRFALGVATDAQRDGRESVD